MSEPGCKLKVALTLVIGLISIIDMSNFELLCRIYDKPAFASSWYSAADVTRSIEYLTSVTTNESVSMKGLLDELFKYRVISKSEATKMKLNLETDKTNAKRLISLLKGNISSSKRVAFLMRETCFPIGYQDLIGWERRLVSSSLECNLKYSFILKLTVESNNRYAWKSMKIDVLYKAFLWPIMNDKVFLL